MVRTRSTFLFALIFFTVCLAEAQDKWLEVRSPNFVVYTNGGDKRGREIALRFEQMRKLFSTLILRDKVHINVPLVIIAFKDTRGLKQVAPMWKGKPIDLAGVYLSGEDKHFIALDLSVQAGYPAVFHEYAHLLLNANFPKTDLWFDEGFAEYYSTIDITPKEVKVGLAPGYAGQILRDGLMPVEKLFAISHDSKEYNENSPKREALYAQSWLAVHYLYDMKKLKAAGDYFDLVINKRKPIAEAMQSAFGMTPKEFDRALDSYFRKNELSVYSWRPPEIEPALYVVNKIKEHQALAQIADFHLHSQDYIEQSAKEFEQVLAADPNHADASRGLGYYYLYKGDIEKAGDYFRRAAALGSKDGRVYFYQAQFLFKHVNGSTRDMTDLQEMSALLDKSIELDPTYAEAFNLKAFVLSAVGNHAGAIGLLRQAVLLSPRNDMYKANLATQFLRDGKYDDAMAMWAYLKNSANPEVATMAAAQFETTKQYKEKPLMRLQGEVMETTAPEWRRKDGAKVDPELQALEERQTGANEEETKAKETKPDTRPVKSLKGLLRKIDCGADGSAILTITSGPRTMRMYTANAEKMLIIGDYKFTCNWKNYKVLVNYKARDTKSGDVVSIEVQ